MLTVTNTHDTRCVTSSKRCGVSELAQISRLAVVSIFFATCAAGCSGSNPTGPVSDFNAGANSSKARVRHLTQPPNYLYVTNRSGSGGQLLVYPANNPHPTLIRSVPLPSSPSSVIADSKGDVYVAFQQTNTIDIFASGGTQLTGTLTQDLNDPIGLAVDPQNNVYVTSIDPDIVYVFAHGATHPFTHMLPPDGATPSSVAVQPSSGTVYVSGQNGGDPFLVECTPVTQPNPTCTHVPGSNLGTKGSLAFTTATTLAVVQTSKLWYFNTQPWTLQSSVTLVGPGNLMTSGTDGTLYIPVLGNTPGVEVIPIGPRSTYTITDSNMTSPYGAAVGI